MDATPQNMANAIRALSMDGVQAANSGHPGMPMGMADVATVLFSDFLKFDASAPDWADRDRFVLSAGHGSMLIYSLLHLTGYAAPTMDDLRNFRQLTSPCAGHPENFLLAGVEATTGPLGQGIAMAVGMAMAERHLNAHFGDDLVDHRTWVIAGDGCLMEGVNHEAIGLAGHLKLGRLNVLWDDNNITIDGKAGLSTSEDIRARYVATGWHVVDCDGHDFDSISAALTAARDDPRPSLVACKTLIGKGAPNKQGTSATHGSPLGADEITAARAELSWDSAPFELPDAIAAAWRALGQKGAAAHADWQARHDASALKADFDARFGDVILNERFAAYKSEIAEKKPNVATRKASEMALEVLTASVAEMLGGSADLTGSNNTKTKSTTPFTADDYAGRYVYYGIREFGMAAAMNGMALHGGVIPYGGTFLVFSDYCRGAIRLAALQRIRSIFVLTHDSIGLGEDGPTHQPIEHIMSLRMMPNLLVFRPADALETAECWELAMQAEATPSVLALTRQNLAAVRDDASENLCVKGAYRLRAANGERKAVVIGTGSEVAIALQVADKLGAQGIEVDVVSMPCTALFDAQDAGYKADLLPADVVKVSIEAGTTFGWERYTGLDGLRFGIDSFGASAPIDDLYTHFGLTVDVIVPQIISKLTENSNS